MKGTSSGEAVRGFPRLFKVLLFGFIAPRDAARTACGRRHAATWRSCGVLAAGRDSVPLAAAPMQKRMQLAPNSAHSPSMGCSWLALRDAARTACGRRRAATWRSCGVLAAGRDSVPLAAAPMQKRMQRAPSPAHSLIMGCSWLALRDAARTACGRRRAATWHTVTWCGCCVSRQAVTLRASSRLIRACPMLLTYFVTEATRCAPPSFQKRIWV